MRYLAIFSCLLLLTPLSQAAQSVNVYSARAEQLIKPLLDTFTEKTGIEVNLVTGKADALLARLKSEGSLSPADVLITTDAGRLHRAKSANLLQAISSDTLMEKIPATYRDKDQQWFGLSLRARPIIYNKNNVDPKTLSTYEALSSNAFRGNICIRSSSNIYNQSLMASIIAADGKEKAQQWANDFVQNFARKPKGGDRDQIKAAASGICDIAIANTYYLGGMLISKNSSQKRAAESVAVFWPNQDGRGTHVNVSGAGVIKTAKNKANAIALIEYLVSPEAQEFYAQSNMEYPVVAGVAVPKVLKAFGTFKADKLNLSQLGELNSEAVMMMDKAGWR